MSTCRTEVGILIGAHAAVVVSAVDTFGFVSGSLVESCFFVLADEIFPFSVEVHLSGNIFFPRLHIKWIDVYGFIFVRIFVSKPRKTVSKLMYDDGFGILVMYGSEQIAVVKSATAIAC